MTLGLRIGRLLLLGILLAPPAHGAVEKVCVDWFAQKKLKAGSPDCVLGCSSASVDLGTFSCPNRCDDLCRPTDSCPSYRRKLDRTVTDSSPRKWEQATEKRKTWTKSERIAVLNALLKLPETLV